MSGDSYEKEGHQVAVAQPRACTARDRNAEEDVILSCVDVSQF